MIRISFTKIQFSQHTQAEYSFIEIAAQNSTTLKLKPKKIKNRLSRFYGDFFEIETNDVNLKIKIYTSETENTEKLVEKIIVRKSTYGLWQKKSHFFQTIKLKLWFDSQKIDIENSKTQQSTNQSSGLMGNFLFDERLGLMKIKREFSPEQKRSTQKQVQFNALVNNPSKNATMKIFPKGTFKDFMRVDL